MCVFIKVYPIERERSKQTKREIVKEKKEREKRDIKKKTNRE